ncbi:hypothetical protein DACRYDRAFT_117795 [Dacryopinax primogenitus]|uniref:Microtubule associated protein n=1 Tax=Dacryopinax primogenitus (strain DJM 731) TaxID=1858805 RepID=M5G184_DACPD|nr:uncharacterized protein DACRYDRAFT_117795 [Dacryopinax primogenitus]EJT99586.1 hypothetical protein DACRYDRAFT_117795 [Dacryopinax primogenitus]
MDATLTPDTLLPALQPPLEHLTHSLPILHRALGLPPSALTSDLAQLRDSLLTAIDQQLVKRKEEVSEWEARCAAVERRVVGLKHKVGGWGKGIIDALEEHTEVLPRRLELLTQQEHKLSGLHTAKLEQISLLSTRLTSLVRSLPENFFPPELLHITTQPQSEVEKEVEAVDVTPERFELLEREILRGKTEISKRTTDLCFLFSELLSLHMDLVISFPSVPEENDLLRPSTGLPSDGTRGCPMTSVTPEALFIQFVARIDECETEGFELGQDLTGMEGIDPTPEVMQWAERLREQLDAVTAQRAARIQEIYNRLEGLWHRLGVDELEVRTFVESATGTTGASVQAYEAELERMEALKREKMSLFITNAREEISTLWEAMMYGEDERERFAPFYDDDHTEELLVRHETEIERLREEEMDKQPILSHVQKYFQLCDEERELEVAAQDPSRLLGKRGDAGRLLREEKMRKRVSREKPKLEKELLDIIPDWETNYGRLFMVHGQSLRQVIEESISASEAHKENKRHKPTAVLAKTAPTPRPASALKRTRTPSANSATGNPSTVKRQKLAQTPATAPAAARATRPLGVATNVYETPGYRAPRTVGKPPAPSTGMGIAARDASGTGTTGYGKLGYGAPPSNVRVPNNSTAVFGSHARIPSATEERIRNAQKLKESKGRRASFRPRPSGAFSYGSMRGVSTEFAAIKGPGWETVQEEDDEN